MKSPLLTTFVAGALAAAAGHAQTTVRLDPELATSSGAVIKSVPKGGLEINSAPGKPATIPVAQLTGPFSVGEQYALTGEVRYANVEGNGYLEMWSYFEGASSGYFSRTLAEGGPMGVLNGSSGWRKFILPFNSRGAPGGLHRLELNVVLPQGGDVTLQNVSLIENTQNLSGPVSSSSSSGWWTDRQAGWIGGLAGSGLGILGAIMGATAWRWPRFALGCGMGMTLFGMAGLVAGITAVCLKQPYAVYYPLLLLGGLVTIVVGANTVILHRRLRVMELRRISAMDVEA